MTKDELNQNIKDLRVRMDILEKYAQELEDSDKGWKPKDREEYYFIESTICPDTIPYWKESNIDQARIASGNYFISEEQAKEVAKRIKQVLQDYQKELYGKRGSFKAGDRVKNKYTGVEDIVVSVPGMDEYDEQPFVGADEGFVLKDRYWEFQKDWELYG